MKNLNKAVSQLKSVANFESGFHFERETGREGRSFKKLTRVRCEPIGGESEGLGGEKNQRDKKRKQEQPPAHMAPRGRAPGAAILDI